MEEHQLFKPERRARYNEYIKGKIRKFIIGYEELDMYFTIGSNPYNRESLKFYSDLFKSMSSLLSEITCYVDGNKLISKREKFKRSIDLFEKVLGLMKVLDQRYLITITSPDPTEDPRWYKESDKTNEEIIEKITILLYEINSLKTQKDRGGVFYPSFSLKNKKTDPYYPNKGQYGGKNLSLHLLYNSKIVLLLGIKNSILKKCVKKILTHNSLSVEILQCSFQPTNTS